MVDYKDNLAKKLSEHLNIDVNKITPLIEIPPQPHLGDYAFPCFILAKKMKAAPGVIASSLEKELSGTMDYIETIKATGPYLNFFLNKNKFCNETISYILNHSSNIGASESGKDKKVIIEYSSPNIAKPFHVGHAFTTVLGQALYNIYSHLGYDVIRFNHLGDYGTQFGKLISAYRRWGDEKALSEDPIKELLRIYVKFHNEAQNDKALEDEARNHFKNLEDGKEFELSLWTLFRDLSIKEFDRVYRRLGIEFDNMNGESFYSSMIPEVVEILKDKNLLVESEGAHVVMLDEYDLPPCIILKSDGTTIYASRDIAAILYRQREYDFYKNIYVVGNPQALHFKQVFAVADKMGLNAEGCVHVGFGLVKFADIKFSTREGNIILLEELLNETVAKTKEIIIKNREERNTGLSDDEVDEIAEKLGIAAVIYTFCRNSRDRDIIFSWDEMLDFEGDSAPYLMYTYARCKSVLRKAEAQGTDIIPIPLTLTEFGNNKHDSLNITDEEFEVCKMMAGFSESIEKSALNNEPYILVRQLNIIARAFNRFYNNYSVLNADNSEERNFRINLCQSTAVVLYQGMKLLGMSPVERM